VRARKAPPCAGNTRLPPAILHRGHGIFQKGAAAAKAGFAATALFS